MNDSDEIMALLERLSRVMQNEIHAAGYKPAQSEALRFIGRANRFSRNPSALTAYLGITKGTVSQTLNSLERKGLIKKTIGAADRRNVELELTKSGNAWLRQDPLAEIVKSVESMSGDEKKSLKPALRHLLEGVLQHRSGRSFGICHTCKYFKRNGSGRTPHYCMLLETPLSDKDSKQHCIEQESIVSVG